MPIVRITEEMIRPNVGENGRANSSWFSTIRSHYARERGGTINLAPSAGDFDYSWRNMIGHRPYQIDVALAERLDYYDVVRQLSVFDIPGTAIYNYWGNAHVHVAIIAMFNVYAKCMEYYNDRIHWKIDFLCHVGDTDIRANKWEAKFHGRCMFNIKRETYDALKGYIERGEQVDAWILIASLYRAQRWLRQLANPRYLQNQPAQPRQPAVRTRRAALASTPQQVSSYSHSGNLSREYLSRTNVDDSGILSCAELGRMIATSQLSPELRDFLHELLLAARISTPVNAESVDAESMARLIESLRIAL